MLFKNDKMLDKKRALQYQSDSDFVFILQIFYFSYFHVHILLLSHRCLYIVVVTLVPKKMIWILYSQQFLSKKCLFQQRTLSEESVS